MLEKDATRCMDGEVDDVVGLNEDKAIDTKEEVKVVGESSRSLSFCKRMKRFLPHHRSLKDRMKARMKNKTVSYVDLLRPSPPPSRTNDKMKPSASRRLANRK